MVIGARRPRHRLGRLLVVAGVEAGKPGERCPLMLAEISARWSREPSLYSRSVASSFAAMRSVAALSCVPALVLRWPPAVV